MAKPKKRPAKAKKPAGRGVPAAKKSSSTGRDGDFRTAFAALLRSRKLSVPKGLLDAPPEAYASQPASVVDQLEGLGDADLRRYAEKVAGHVQRQADRARREWESSPLIAELRRRGLKEPTPPRRPAGVSVSLAKPMKEWSDKQILRAATDWSKLGAR